MARATRELLKKFAAAYHLCHAPCQAKEVTGCSKKRRCKKREEKLVTRFLLDARFESSQACKSSMNTAKHPCEVHG